MKTAKCLSGLCFRHRAGSGLATSGAIPACTTRLHAAYLAEKILTSRSALAGERKQITVLFADLKGSMELLADRDPEEARQLLDPVLERIWRPCTAMKAP